MSNWKFAAPLGLAAVCVSGIAFAGMDYVFVDNKDKVSHTVQWTTGDIADCDKHTSRGTNVIAPKAELKLKIKNERWICIRRPGGPWYKEDLRGKTSVVRLRIDDPGK
jgi:hypothetical protein